MQKWDNTKLVCYSLSDKNNEWSKYEAMPKDFITETYKQELSCLAPHE